MGDASVRYESRMMRRLAKRQLQREYTFEELRREFYDLRAPQTEDIDLIIFDYYCTHGGRDGETKIPYKGRTPSKRSKKENDIINILYNFDNFPPGLQQLLFAYLDYLVT